MTDYDMERAALIRALKMLRFFLYVVAYFLFAALIIIAGIAAYQAMNLGL